MKKRTGFTLIELLIVVAIIAILAAIAVPNFLEAQTRAKVSRIKAEMRTHATALESYRVDNNDYPFPDDIQGGILTASDARTFFETKAPIALTTPIAYITRLSDDVFRNLDETSETYLPYHYASREYADEFSLEAGTQEFDGFALAMWGSLKPQAAWYLLSHGPDSDHDAGPSGGGAAPGLPGHITDDGVVVYDPTNGTVSNGDLVTFGPGLGFPDDR